MVNVDLLIPKAYYQKDNIIEISIKTTNGDRVKLFCPGDLNLRSHECGAGASTFVLPRRYNSNRRK